MGRSRRVRRRWALGGSAIAVMVLAGSCSSAGTTNATGPSSGGTAVPTTEAQAVDGGVLVMAIPAETAGWDPRTAEWASFTMLEGSTMLESLAITDEKGDAQPWLATSFTPNASFDVWTIKLRPNVTFHDGEPFDATAVKANLDFAVTAPVSSIALGGAFKDTKVIDPLTVEIDLAYPWASFPSSFLDGQSAVMMAPNVLRSEDHGTKHPVGTGPFVFDTWQPDNNLKVKKNPTYWQKGLPHLDSINFRVITDSNSAQQALKAGDVDSIMTTDAEVANNADPSDSVAKDWNTEPNMLAVNTLETLDGKTNPLHNQHARTALALATDRNALAADIGDGVSSPTSPFASDTQWGRPDDKNHYPAFDLDKAKQEVDAYKKDTGQSSLAVTIDSNTAPTTVRTMQRVQQMWQAAGIEVTLQSVEDSTLITDVLFGKYQVADFSVYSSPDPDQYRYFWGSQTALGAGKLSINFTQYSTPSIDKALDVVRQSNDFATRKAATDGIVDQINEAATNIWMYWTPYSIISSGRVHGMQGATTEHVANFQPKSFLRDVWINP